MDGYFQAALDKGKVIKHRISRDGCTFKRSDAAKGKL